MCSRMDRKIAVSVKDYAERAKALWLFCAAAIILCPLFIYMYWKLGAPIAGFLVLWTLPFIFLTYFVWRISRSPAIAGNWVMAVGFCLFLASSLFTGGIVSPAVTWSLTIPVVATLICGPKSGIVWFVLVMSEMVGLYWNEEQGHAFIQEYTRENFRTAFYISVLGITFFSFYTGIIFEFFRTRHIRRMERNNRLLREALDKVRTLSGLLPICAWCKKVRDDHGYWDQVEVYLKAHTEVEFSHGICPDCMAKQTQP